MSRLTALTIAASLLAAPVCAAASTFDAALDFSAVNNPNGAWSYGYVQSGAFTTYSTSSTVFYGASTWNRGNAGPGISQYPLVYHNGTGQTFSYGTGTIVPGELGLHPGDGGIQSAIRWTAPVAGPYFVSISFTRDDLGIADGSLRLNGTTLFSTLVTTTGLPQVFETTFSASSGDQLYALVGWGNNATIFGDTVELKYVITAVPESGTALLLAVGLAGLILTRSTARRTDA